MARPERGGGSAKKSDRPPRVMVSPISARTALSGALAAWHGDLALVYGAALGLAARLGFRSKPAPWATGGTRRETKSLDTGRHPDIRLNSIRYPSYMTKRLIEVDDDKLAEVRALLGTSTLKATVSAAFDELLALDRRRRDLLAQHGVTDDLLADPSRRQAAWR